MLLTLVVIVKSKKTKTKVQTHSEILKEEPFHIQKGNPDWNGFFNTFFRQDFLKSEFRLKVANFDALGYLGKSRI